MSRRINVNLSGSSSSADLGGSSKDSNDYSINFSLNTEEEKGFTATAIDCE